MHSDFVDCRGRGKVSDRTRLDVRDNELYKLILNQSNEREALLYSCKQTFNDLIDFHYEPKRKLELMSHQTSLIDKLMTKHRKEINSVDLGTIW